jgi:hypothetical protein
VPALSCKLTIDPIKPPSRPALGTRAFRIGKETAERATRLQGLEEAVAKIQAFCSEACRAAAIRLRESVELWCRPTSGCSEIEMRGILTSDLAITDLS